ncbi:MAG: response regulator transcription factor [Chloroflexi bacterium]|uniref:response regulator transcription factor n=1 Tax=Candidatus Flexifilum breve TaxID=3140694 RepID=UPI0031376A89|nr:response regulator transcription factor [Chloroflexota bacterium]MBK9747416.1 response regulator transcription factor [Chloroflexota bacterium]
MSDSTTILLADDHAILRSGLRLLVESQPDFKVVGEAGTGKEAIAKARELQPNLILLDLNMPELDGLDALPAIRKEAPDSRILILTMHDDVSYLQEALRTGASGYILKKAVDSDLITALRTVLRGETYVHSAMTQKLLQKIDQQAAKPAPEADPWATLSDRERDVLRLVALGYTNAEIASELFLSVKTVETYRTRGMEKLNFQTRAQLVKAALEKGLLE